MAQCRLLNNSDIFFVFFTQSVKYFCQCFFILKDIYFAFSVTNDSLYFRVVGIACNQQDHSLFSDFPCNPVDTRDMRTGTVDNIASFQLVIDRLCDTMGTDDDGLSRMGFFRR